MPTRLIVALFVITLGWGCGDGEPQTNTVTVGGNVTIQALSIERTREMDNVRPSSGDYFAAIELELTNNFEDDSIPVNPVMFHVRTDGGLTFTPTAAGMALSDCPESAELEAGHSLECVIVFELDDNSRPVTLLYRSPDDELEASDDIDAGDCTFCGDDCVDLSDSSQHCGQCNRVVPSGANCEDGEMVCDGGRTLCEGSCVDVDSDPDHCGACGNAMGIYESCRNGEGVCRPGYTRCSGECTSTMSDRDNCGECGNRCDSVYCNSGTCVYHTSRDCWSFGTSCDTCEEHCGNDRCVEAKVDYSPGECSELDSRRNVPLACGESPTVYEDCSPSSINCFCEE